MMSPTGSRRNIRVNKYEMDDICDYLAYYDEEGVFADTLARLGEGDPNAIRPELGLRIALFYLPRVDLRDIGYNDEALMKNLLYYFDEMERQCKVQCADTVTELSWVSMRRKIVVQTALGVLHRQLQRGPESAPPRMKEDIHIPEGFDTKIYERDAKAVFKNAYSTIGAATNVAYEELNDVLDIITINKSQQRAKSPAVRASGSKRVTRNARAAAAAASSSSSSSHSNAADVFVDEAKICSLFQRRSFPAFVKQMDAFYRRVEDAVLSIPRDIGDYIENPAALAEQDWEEADKGRRGPYAAAANTTAAARTGKSSSSSSSSSARSPAAAAATVTTGRAGVAQQQQQHKSPSVAEAEDEFEERGEEYNADGNDQDNDDDEDDDDDDEDFAPDAGAAGAARPAKHAAANKKAPRASSARDEQGSAKELPAKVRSFNTKYKQCDPIHNAMASSRAADTGSGGSSVRLPSKPTKQPLPAAQHRALIQNGRQQQHQLDEDFEAVAGDSRRNPVIDRLHQVQQEKHTSASKFPMTLRGASPAARGRHSAAAGGGGGGGRTAAGDVEESDIDALDDDDEHLFSGSGGKKRRRAPGSVAKVKRAKAGKAGFHKRARWTYEEEEIFIEAVSRHGIGAWRPILEDPEYSIALEGRTNINLKDKYRNLQKQGRV